MKTKLAIFYLIMILPLFISCSDKSERVPDWSKKVVWYQIFPERFCNGDKTNDPTPKDMEGGWPYFIPEGWQISTWTSDWYRLQPWEKATGKDFYGNVGVRRYGGDLQGIIDKLDYLQDLGVTAIYLNPVFESPSLHKYDAAYYNHIDNNFGPDPEGDRKVWATETQNDPSTWKWTSADKLFLKLVDDCHKRGMKIIIDGVFNHVGAMFWAFRDVEEKQQNSEFKDWFTIHEWDNPATKENEFKYEGWFGVKDLPELKEDENGLIPPIQNHIKAIVQRWMDPNNDGDPSDGIDGWRLDVADMVNIKFWRTFRTWVKGINPEAYITGEIWWDDWDKNVMYDASPWLQGDTFDAVMNYRFARAVKHYVANQKDKIDAEGFIDSLKTVASEYDKDNLYALMNLLDSHDVERFSSMIVNPDIWYDHHGNPQQTRDWNVSAPDELGWKKFRLAVGLQMTLPGAPMVYYGDEAGMWGGDDPDCRKPMVWKDLTYETETTHPFGLKRDTNKVEFNSGLFDWYKKLIALRNENIELSVGDVDYKVYDNGILQYTRSLGEKKSIILVNNFDHENAITLEPDNNKVEMKDLMDNSRLVKEGNGYVVKLAPYELMILK